MSHAKKISVKTSQMFKISQHDNYNSNRKKDCKHQKWFINMQFLNFTVTKEKCMALGVSN